MRSFPWRCKNTGSLPRRRGISLLEVLISMFVMLVGAVSLFALITLGRYEMLEGSKADQAMSVARSAQRLLKADGMLRPVQNDGSGNLVQMWLDPTGTPFVTSPNPTMPFQLTINGSSPALTYDSAGFVLDPLGVAVNSTNGSAITNFPPQYTFNDAPGSSSSPYTARLFRVTLRSAASASMTGLGGGAADLFFRAQDDLILQPPTGDFPPQQLFAGPTGSPTRRQSQGDYSWLATIVPGHGDPLTAMVSIVIFYKRVTLLPATAASAPSPPPPERMVTVNLSPAAPATAPTGLGGGEVQLATTMPNSDYLTVKPNQWIMLSQPSYMNSATVLVPAWFRWYKIVAVDTIQGSSGAWFRNVTLAGPDWNPFPTGSANAGTPPTFASLIDGVIGVYEKAMVLEESGSVWSPN
jgi:type II secretory pathway pseudopilin PulG